MLKNILFSSLLLSLLFFSCKEDDLIDTFPGERTAFLNGIFVLNGGENNTGTLSFFDKLNQNTSQQIFQNVNDGQMLGNGVHSMALTSEHLWISATDNNEIILADPDFLTETRRITSINEPRFILLRDAKSAYITHRNPGTSNNDFLTKIDSSGNFLKTFATKVTDNQPIINGNLIYFPNGNLNGADSTLTYINITADTIVGDSILPALNPTEVVSQASGIVWILCAGGIDEAGNAAAGALLFMRNQLVEFKITLPAGARNLVISNDNQYLFYVLAGKVYRQLTENTIRETTPFLDRNYTFLSIDPTTGDLYGALSDENDGIGNIFRHNSENGELTASFESGVMPRGIVFK